MNRETGRNGDYDGTDNETRTLAVDVFQLYRGNWREDDRAADADDIRQEIRHGDRSALTHAAFNRLYEHKGRESVTVTLEDSDGGGDDGDQEEREAVISTALGRVWGRWNRGSGRESRTFIDAETRSLEVSDLLAVDGELYFVAPIGWREADLRAVCGEVA